MAQKIYCPMCKKLLIPNDDLVIDDEIVFDMDRIKETDKQIKHIKCENCKRRIRYFVNK